MTGLWALQLMKWAGARQSSLRRSVQPSVELVPGDTSPGESEQSIMLWPLKCF